MVEGGASLRRTLVGLVGLIAGAVAFAAFGLTTPSMATGAAPPAHWARARHIAGVLDLAGPRSDGSLAVAAAGHLALLTGDGAIVSFARGSRGYSTARGPEPYITLSTGQSDPRHHCSFHQDTIFAIEPNHRPGIVQIDTRGHARRFANLPAGVRPNGIAFDAVGNFGHQLLVTAASGGGAALFAVSCSGSVATVAMHIPVVEGGIAVAPASFGPFGGDLIAPDETSGRIYAIKPNGTAATLLRSPLASGGDIGVESAGFVPPGFGPNGAAYLADRVSPGNRHPGTDSLLQLSGSELIRAGVHPGDLLVASEGGAKTIAVRCENACTARRIADGPGVAHGEGHIEFATSI